MKEEEAASHVDAPRLLARKSCATLVSAAVPLIKRGYPETDEGGGRCLLRACAWIVGIKDAMETEGAIIASLDEQEYGRAEWNKEHSTSLFEKLSGPEPTCIGMLQLVEALIRRRVANAQKLTHAMEVVVRIFSFRGSLRVRGTVVSVMAWASRCPKTRRYLFDRYDETNLKPIQTAAKDYARLCGIDPWVVEAQDDYEGETAVCLSDGGIQAGVFNVDNSGHSAPR